MGLFEDAATFEKCLTGFFQLMADTPVIADKLLASNLIVRFTYADPDVVIVVDCSRSRGLLTPSTVFLDTCDGLVWNRWKTGGCSH